MINGMIGYVRGHRRIDWSSNLCTYAKSLRIVTMAIVRMNGTTYLNHCKMKYKHRKLSGHWRRIVAIFIYFQSLKWTTSVSAQPDTPSLTYGARHPKTECGGTEAP